MTERIPIRRTEEGMKKQVLYLLKLHFRNELKAFKFMITVVAAISIVAVGYKMQDAQGNLPTWLFMLTIWAWMSLVFFFIKEVVNYNRAKWKARRTVKEYIAFAPENAFSYDEEKIRYHTGDQSTEKKWSDLSSYKEHEDCLYLTFDKKILESLYFAKTDIGDDAYAALRSIILRKIA
jgi:hypothetical protein